MENKTEEELLKEIEEHRQAIFALRAEYNQKSAILTTEATKLAREVAERFYDLHIGDIFKEPTFSQVYTYEIVGFRGIRNYHLDDNGITEIQVLGQRVHSETHQKVKNQNYKPWFNIETAVRGKIE